MGKLHEKRLITKEHIATNVHLIIKHKLHSNFCAIANNTGFYKVTQSLKLLL